MYVSLLRLSEKLSDKGRNKNKKLEDLVKAKKHSNDESTMEFKEDLECDSLIKEFEKSYEAMQSTATKRKSSASPPTKPAQKKNKEEGRPNGFGRRLVPERIIGAMLCDFSNGELMFLMKWKGSDEADFVPAHKANIVCPQLVIQFYESRLTWDTSQNESQE